MKNRLDIFKTYFYVHFCVLVFFLGYLLLSYKDLIQVSPIFLAVLLWLNIGLLIFSVFFIGYKKIINGKDFAFNSKVLMALAFDLVFVIVFTIDPLYILAKALD